MIYTNSQGIVLPFSFPMVKLRSALHVIALLLPLTLLAGCGYSSDTSVNGLHVQVEDTAIPNPGPTSTAVPTTFVPPVFADCGSYIYTGAFVDKNSNKRWDKGEPPLAGVKFHIDDTLNHITDVTRVEISDDQGKAQISVFLGGCPDIRLEIYPEIPSGYTLTTKQRISTGYGTEDKPILFGFSRLADRPTLPGMPGTGHPAFSGSQNP